MAEEPPAPFTPAGEEAAARAVLSAPTWAFVFGAAGAEETSKLANRRAWDSVFLEHRLPADVSRRSSGSVVFGVASEAPIAVAPMALPAQVWPHGDLEIAAACAEVGIPVAVSTMASARIEDIAKSGARCAFQLYWLRDAALRRQLVARAEDAGCVALLITVDAPVPRGSERERFVGYQPGVDVEPVMAGSAEIDPSLSWPDIEELIASTRLPVYVKGILSPEAAQRAQAAGAAGVVVSNHGGRQLDCALPTALALPRVNRALHATDRGFDVVVDSGITTGTDVVRALALGASSVLIGRQVLYGLARGGMQGVLNVLRRITAEFAQTLTMTGCTTPAEAANLHPHIIGT
ncbi:alpha-hydroxy acid oxidase [Saccharopolyspora shandongensis]|uniref:alpha-hydroxy acid oxidase n=1 Tax=Saccharopolyspora shandongensis TaxID=418495 RepID=UPI0033CB9F2C